MFNLIIPRHARTFNNPLPISCTHEYEEVDDNKTDLAGYDNPSFRSHPLAAEERDKLPGY